MELITIILIGISLSMDTFSLSLCYGTLNFTTTKIFTLSSIVGMFHFVMPGLGMAFGHLMNYFFILNIKILIFVIFFLLGLEMINNAINRNKKIIFLNKIGMIIFGFTVSIDSFLAGIGLEFISPNHLLCSSIFALSSFGFTFFGLKLGYKINKKMNNLGPLLGGIILIVLAFINFCK
ncbi:MAG: manganese efflux pump [Bacilli bacterium]|jgi:putative Mn2+ efflux pump MntP|nr:manganese efflux pump [Bacilli bacterium]